MLIAGKYTIVFPTLQIGVLIFGHLCLNSKYLVMKGDARIWRRSAWGNAHGAQRMG